MMNEFLEQFLIESRDLVAQGTDDLMALAENPNDRERLDSAFRAFHTLKGAAGIVEFGAMMRTLHAAEDILASLRSSEEPINPDTLDEFLTCLDVTSRWLDAMQSTGEAPSTAEADADDMIVRLMGSGGAAEVSPASAPRDDAWIERLSIVAGNHFTGHRTALRYIPSPDAFFQGPDPMNVVAALPHPMIIDVVLSDPTISLESMSTFSCNLEIVALMEASGEQVRAALLNAPGKVEVRELASTVISPSEEVRATARTLIEAQLLLLQESDVDGLVGRQASAGRTAVNALLYLGRSELAANVERAIATTNDENSPDILIAAVEQALSGIGQPEPPNNSSRSSPVAPRALRVDMDRIDALVKLTGELIVVKNAIGHTAKLFQENEDPRVIMATLRTQHALFERLATELQNAVLRIRVLPLRSAFRRFPRLIREIAGSVGKTVRLIIEGESTEADATIVDALFEPLLHVLRNAVDHGIESPERRASAGKSAMGTLILRARRDADTVKIEVEDDGGGIDVDRVRAVACARGIATAETLAAMTDAEALGLVFAVGFSTASTVSNLSGRGVGMDSVRTAVERLGGQVTLESQPGIGTRVGLVIPFSLMMTRVMTVEVAGQAFGLPLDNVVETAIVPRDRIVPIGAGRAFVLRDQTVPLIDLADTLGIQHTDRLCPDQAKVVVALAAGQIGAIEVDRLGERMDVMLTPMEGLLNGMKGVSGTTLLGDGRVLIVLDVQEILS
jgi:two-component system chemotaxis sensor kinase CheA